MTRCLFCVKPVKSDTISQRTCSRVCVAFQTIRVRSQGLATIQAPVLSIVGRLEFATRLPFEEHPDGGRGTHQPSVEASRKRRDSLRRGGVSTHGFGLPILDRRTAFGEHRLDLVRNVGNAHARRLVILTRFDQRVERLRRFDNRPVHQVTVPLTSDMFACTFQLGNQMGNPLGKRPGLGAISGNSR